MFLDNMSVRRRLWLATGLVTASLLASVQRVSDLIGEISNAAGEQSQGIDQVIASVVTIDQMTQRNAALVEQSAAAADSLKQQATMLSGLVASFRLGEHQPKTTKA